MRLTANEVGPLKGLGGSNPLVSARFTHKNATAVVFFPIAHFASTSFCPVNTQQPSIQIYEFDA